MRSVRIKMTSKTRRTLDLLRKNKWMFSQQRPPDIVPLTGDGLSSLNALTGAMSINLGNCAAYK